MRFSGSEKIGLGGFIWFRPRLAGKRHDGRACNCYIKFYHAAHLTQSWFYSLAVAGSVGRWRLRSRVLVSWSLAVEAGGGYLRTFGG